MKLMFNTLKYNLQGDPRSVIDYVLDGNELGPEIIMAIKSTPLYNEYGTVGFQPRKKVLRFELNLNKIT